jgi:hypothetical protein
MAAPQTTSPAAAVGRIFWMLIGPVLLLLLTFSIISQGTGWLTVTDLLFFLALGAMLLGRWLEFRAGNPQTATGEPATAQQVYRYLFVAGAVGLAVWVVANFLGNHWLKP